MSKSSESFQLAELKLEQELRQMFEVDSQKDLETYLTCVKNLQEHSWKANIQNMYRAIHTIKGGSVTVNADGIVEVATVLEDLLSDLRYLNHAPSLEDGNLQQMLLEGGEIIASVLGNQQEKSAIQAKVAYVENLKQKIQASYFADWQEKTQLQIEFAEQGFDLVVLDLEIAINQLPTGEIVPSEVIELAAELIEQLGQIGEDIELESGWTKILAEASELVNNPDADLWKLQWSELLPKLKTSALNGGQEIQEESNSLTDDLLDEIDLLDDEQVEKFTQKAIATSTSNSNSTDDLLDEIDLLDNEQVAEITEKAVMRSMHYVSAFPINSNSTDDLLEEIDLLDDEQVAEITEKAVMRSMHYVSASPVSSNLTNDLLDEIDLLDDEQVEEITQQAIVSPVSSNLTDDLLEEIDLLDDEQVEKSLTDTSNLMDDSLEEVAWLSEQEIAEVEKQASEFNSFQSSSVSIKSVTTESSPKDIQVPIPVAKLDKSAQSIVDTLMVARAMESSYQNLHQDLLKLIGIAKDSVQYLAQLRQIQGDYTLLNDLDQRLSQTGDSPSVERYRKGYVTINRLLENNLRLSEIGTEAEQKAEETTQRLEKLNKGIIQLKDIVEESRLVPFRNLTFRARAIVRDLMARYGKLVNLTVEGEQIELDVSTSRRIEPILLHLIRNAYDHGLETPAERKSQGKPEQGSINLTLQRYGSTYTIKLTDDGQGIDPAKIAAKAKQLNLPLTNTGTSSELLSVISQSGFSSRCEVSEVSGRGVGMDVVAEQISLLNASWQLDTTVGKGTTFQINFPVPHLLVSCLLVQCGDSTFAIPTEKIVTTSLWQDLKASPVEDPHYLYNWEIENQNNKTPGLDLLEYWDHDYHNRVLDSSAIAVFVKPQPDSSGFWLLADKMLGKLELKIQPLPLPLVTPKGVIGVSLQNDNSLIPVIEPNSLQEVLTTEVVQTTTEDLGQVNNQAPTIYEDSQTILIVDDAALMRRRIEATLSAYGYTTYTCADGLEAWNWMKSNPQPMLMITDIEMPNMDGFTLIDRCRQEQMNFPIMVISSRLAEEWGKEASRLGATDFLTKGFSTSELLDRVNSLLVN